MLLEVLRLDYRLSRRRMYVEAGRRHGVERERECHARIPHAADLHGHLVVDESHRSVIFALYKTVCGALALSRVLESHRAISQTASGSASTTNHTAIMSATRFGVYVGTGLASTLPRSSAVVR